jgi:hypothetical protein
MHRCINSMSFPRVKIWSLTEWKVLGSSWCGQLGLCFLSGCSLATRRIVTGAAFGEGVLGAALLINPRPLPLGAAKCGVDHEERKGRRRR